nr:MAG TPA: hypothetical protein [Caudoviricetes sp.]
MTNREAHKDTLDNLLAGIVAVVDGKPVRCGSVSCEKCLFRSSLEKNECTKKTMDWLNAEYQDPSVDWSKVPIDTPVLASNDGEYWSRQYFAGIGDDGNPKTFYAGATSWSNCIIEHCSFKYMKLAEGNE